MTMTAIELLEKLIKSQEQIIEIWQNSSTKYGRGNYDQAVATLKYLQGYENF
jgi:hypothetical protein